MNVCVVIPTYNNAQFIISAVESVFSQTYPISEIIVVDDGSTDNTKEVLHIYSDKIKYIAQDNSGPAIARNTGIQHAHEQYIAFLDADDVWLPNKIEKQMRLFSDNPETALVYSKIVNFDSETNRDLTILPERIYSGRIFDQLLKESIILLSGVVIKKSILDNLGGFDESLFTAEDTNLYLKVAKKYAIIGSEEILVRRRKHLSNLSDNVNIRIGTLDNLDRIVDLYPENSPSNYKPMKEAYYVRGKGLMIDLLQGAKYKECHDVCNRLLSLRCVDLEISYCWCLTMLSPIFLNIMRRIKQYLKNDFMNEKMI